MGREKGRLDHVLGVITDDLALQRSGLPLPECACKGRLGLADAYQDGATPDDDELCMMPWGGRYSSCSPLYGNGRCQDGAKKCKVHKSTNDAAVDGDAQFEGGQEPCLCIFDIDRTLTAKQFTFKRDPMTQKQKCPGSKPVWGAWDNAYGVGTLTLSALGSGGIAQTACGICYMGVCSRGSAGNSEEKRIIAEQVLNTAPFRALLANQSDAKLWTYGLHIPAKSPLVLRAGDRRKQWAVEGILAWYWSKGI